MQAPATLNWIHNFIQDPVLFCFVGHTICDNKPHDMTTNDWDRDSNFHISHNISCAELNSFPVSHGWSIFGSIALHVAFLLNKAKSWSGFNRVNHLSSFHQQTDTTEPATLSTAQCLSLRTEECLGKCLYKNTLMLSCSVSFIIT